MLANLALITSANAAAPTMPSEGPMSYADPFVGTGGTGHTFPGAAYPFGMVQLSPMTDQDSWENCSGYYWDNASIRNFSHINLSGTGWTDTGDVGMFPIIADTSGITGSETEITTFPAIPGGQSECQLVAGTWSCESLCADGTKKCKGWRGQHDHSKEKAWPGYYSVEFANYPITAELAAMRRSGRHRYTFATSAGATAGTKPLVVMDLMSRLFPNSNIVTEIELSVSADGLEVSGHAKCGYNCWRYNYLDRSYEPSEGKTHFHAILNTPVSRVISGPEMLSKNENFLTQVWAKDGIATFSKNIRCLFQNGTVRCPTMFLEFDHDLTASNLELTMDVGISHTSVAAAKNNLTVDGFVGEFDKAYEDTQTIWTDKMNKILVEGSNEDMKKVFYSGLYHTYLHPVLTSDAPDPVTDECKFVAFDNVYETQHVAELMGVNRFENYSTFSTWDTFRNLHPLMALLEPEVTGDWVNSIISRHHVGDYIALWELMGGDVITQIGYPSVPVIVNAIKNGVPNLNLEAIFEAVYAVAHKNVDSSSDGPAGLVEYMTKGYVPSDIDAANADEQSKSVSKTLEMAFEDHCIAELAMELGDGQMENYFRMRAANWKNLWNPATMSLWPKTKAGQFLDGLDITSNWDDLNKYWIAGNYWGYNFFVPHDVPDLLMNFHGGETEFEAALDAYFTYADVPTDAGHPDISGWIGGYAHGEESSSGNAWLYHYARKPEKSQVVIDQILSDFYKPTPHQGYINNEDCGQMSAWMIWSSIGLFPHNVCSNELLIGKPAFDRVTLNLPNAKMLTISNEGTGSHVGGFSVDGVISTDPTRISLDQVKNGGELIMTTTNDPVVVPERPTTTDSPSGSSTEGSTDANSTDAPESTTESAIDADLANLKSIAIATLVFAILGCCAAIVAMMCSRKSAKAVKVLDNAEVVYVDEE